MSRSAPPVTALVPVYDGARYVEETIECLRAQTCPSLRVLISVDRSTDRSAQICEPLGSRDGWSVVLHDARLGYVGNVNYCLSRVDTDFFFIMPQDDLVSSDYVTTLVEHLVEHEEAVVAYPDIDRFGDATGSLRQPSLIGSKMERVVDFLCRHLSAVAFRGMVRASAVPPRGLPGHSKLDFGADAVWLLDLCGVGELQRVPELRYRKRIHSESAFQHSRTASPPEQAEAWLDHCVQCALTALRHAATSSEAVLMVSASACRLGMRFRNLWPPAEIAEMSEPEVNTLTATFYARLRESLRRSTPFYDTASQLCRDLGQAHGFPTPGRSAG